jgi:NAD(P)-dependent dehydrogenase (short-subunit alcohol dehydrogenase family)
MNNRLRLRPKEKNMRLSAKVALITGAGSGIGRATALLFAKEGAEIAVNDINLAGAQETCDAIKKMGGNGLPFKADVADEKEVMAMVGIINLTRVMALEWAPYRINVNCIIPGGINTPMTKAHVATLTPEVIKELIPLGRMGEPEDIAKPALFLVSDDASFITGVALPVDGGELTRY